MKQATLLLKSLGMPSTYNGYHYLLYGLSLVLGDCTYLLSVTKRLYPDIAAHFHTSAACVEHSLRTAVNRLWADCAQETLTRIAGHPLHSKPTVSEFMDILAGYLQPDYTVR